MNKINQFTIPPEVLNTELIWTDETRIDTERTIETIQEAEAKSSFVIDYNEFWKRIPSFPAILIRYAWELSCPITTTDGKVLTITKEDLTFFHVSDDDMIKMKK